MAKQRSQIRAGVILSYITIGAQILINLVFTPVTLRLLGQSEYGLYSTAVSTINMLSILSLGFGSTYIKKYSEYKKANDNWKIEGLNGLYLVILSVIGLIGLFCGLFLSFNLNLIFDKGLTTVELQRAKILMLLLTVNLAASFPLSMFNSIIGANERFVFQKVIYMLRAIASPLVMIMVLLAGYASIAMVLTTVCFTFLAEGLNLYYCVSRLKVRFRFSKWEPGIFKELFAYTIFIAINMVIDQVNWNIDKVIIGRYRGTGSVAVYSVGHTIHMLYIQLAQSISNVFIPRVHSIANRYNHDIALCAKPFTELFTKIGRIQFAILGLICSGFILFGKTFVRLWAGDDYINAYYVCMLLMIPSTITYVQTLGIEIQRSLNKHQFRSLFYLGMAVCKFVASIFLCKKWGEIGSALGTCIALVLADGIAMNIYYRKALALDIAFFWKQLTKMMIGFLIPIIIGIVYSRFFDKCTWVSLLIGIVVYSIVYCVSMFYFGMNEYEKQLIRKPLLRIKKKK